MFWTVTDATLDEEDALYYRDPRYIGQKSPNGGKVLWSRGNGWVFAAFPRILRYMPDDVPQRERYVDLYCRMAPSLATRQQDDGYWRSNLADPQHFSMPENSGTAFFTAGYAWGVRNGVLDRDEYLPVVIRGWNALVDAVHPDGKLGWVQPVAAQPGASGPDTTHEYAAGLMLFAAGEVYLLAKEGIITPEAVRAALPTEAAELSRRSGIDAGSIQEGSVHAARWSLANQMERMSYQNMCAAYGNLKIATIRGMAGAWARSRNDSAWELQETMR